jgi:hypothetical protein
MNCELMLTYDTPALRQTGSRNLTGQITLPTIWDTYMKLVTKYQISAINSCWEKCDEKCAYMFNVYKNQLSRQTGSRNLTGPKTLPTIWYTYMMLVTKYQISAINSYWEKCDEKYLGRTEDSGGIIKKFQIWNYKCIYISTTDKLKMIKNKPGWHCAHVGNPVPSASWPAGQGSHVTHPVLLKLNYLVITCLWSWYDM